MTRRFLLLFYASSKSQVSLQLAGNPLKQQKTFKAKKTLLTTFSEEFGEFISPIPPALFHYKIFLRKPNIFYNKAGRLI